MVCQQYSLLTHLASTDGKVYFRFAELDEIDRTGVARLAKSHWVSGADFFVRTNLAIPSNGRAVVIICEKPFDNVPQPTIWNFYRKNPAHAAGYSDGSKGLISPAEFALLDLAEFVLLSSVPTNNLPTAEAIQP